MTEEQLAERYRELISDPDLCPHEKRKIKTIFYALIYGGGRKRISEMLDELEVENSGRKYISEALKELEDNK